MARTRVRRSRVLALVVACCVGLGGPVARAVAHSRPEGNARTHVVRPGDTLWAIATRLEPSEDPREVVHAIAAVNRLDAGALVPGQEILVPPVG